MLVVHRDRLPHFSPGIAKTSSDAWAKRAIFPSQRLIFRSRFLHHGRRSPRGKRSGESRQDHAAPRHGAAAADQVPGGRFSIRIGRRSICPPTVFDHHRLEGVRDQGSCLERRRIADPAPGAPTRLGSEPPSVPVVITHRVSRQRRPSVESRMADPELAGRETARNGAKCASRSSRTRAIVPALLGLSRRALRSRAMFSTSSAAWDPMRRV